MMNFRDLAGKAGEKEGESEQLLESVETFHAGCKRKNLSMGRRVTRLLNECFSVCTDFYFHCAFVKFFFFFFFLVYFPQLYLWDSLFWMRFLSVWPFFNPTIEVATFRLHGSCMLGVFLLSAFTHLEHEYQDLLSPCDGMHVYTD